MIERNNMAKKVSEKVFKDLSHAERMYNNAEISKRFKKWRYPSCIEQTVEEVRLVDGVKEITSVSKKVNFKDMNRGLRWYDFSIDSLELSGAIANITLAKVPTNNLQSADNLISQSNKIEASLQK